MGRRVDWSASAAALRTAAARCCGEEREDGERLGSREMVMVRKDAGSWIEFAFELGIIGGGLIKSF